MPILPTSNADSRSPVLIIWSSDTVETRRRTRVSTRNAGVPWRTSGRRTRAESNSSSDVVWVVDLLLAAPSGSRCITPAPSSSQEVQAGQLLGDFSPDMSDGSALRPRSVPRADVPAGSTGIRVRVVGRGMFEPGASTAAAEVLIVNSLRLSTRTGSCHEQPASCSTGSSACRGQQPFDVRRLVHVVAAFLRGARGRSAYRWATCAWSPGPSLGESRSPPRPASFYPPNNADGPNNPVRQRTIRRAVTSGSAAPGDPTESAAHAARRRLPGGTRCARTARERRLIAPPA